MSWVKPDYFCNFDKEIQHNVRIIHLNESKTERNKTKGPTVDPYTPQRYNHPTSPGTGKDRELTRDGTEGGSGAWSDESRWKGTPQ